MAEKDMRDTCFICSRDSYDFEHEGRVREDGWFLIKRTWRKTQIGFVQGLQIEIPTFYVVLIYAFIMCMH